MKRFKHIYAICLIVAQLMFYTIANAQQFNLRHLDDGPNFECYSIIQDSKGYIWISTEKGVCRYDGNTYKWFNKDPDGRAIFSSFHLIEDAQGRIIFNILDGSIFYIQHDSVFLAGCSKKFVKILQYGKSQMADLYVDQNHLLWIATANRFYRTVRPDDYSDIISIPQPAKTDSCHFGITVVDNKRAMPSQYAGTRRKVFGGFVYTWFLNREGNIAKYEYKVGPYNMPSYSKTLMLNNGSFFWSLAHQLFIVTPDGKMTLKIIEGEVVYMWQDRSGGIWMGTDIGLDYYADGSLDSEPMRLLRGKSITGITADSENGIWITTYNAGVFYLNSKYVRDYNNVDGMEDNIVSIYALNDKILYSDRKNFMGVIQNNTFRKIELPKESYKQAVNDYCVVGGELYFAVSLQILKMDTSLNGKYCVMAGKDVKATGLNYGLTATADTTIYSVSVNDIETIKNDRVVAFVPGYARGNVICATHKGEVFVGYSKGLCTFSQGENTYLGNNDKFLAHSISALKEDRKGNLWIGTAAGGVGVYSNGKIILTKSVKDGLASDEIKDIAFDYNGNTWVATDKGLSKIYPAKGYLIENLDTRDGLFTNDINRLTVKGNELWLGTKTGISVIDINHFGENKVPPRVYITTVYVNDSVRFGENDFGHGFNNFRFHLAGLTFKDNKLRFSYRLIGADTTWHTVNFSEVQYNSLGWGKYRFEAKAINADGVSSSEPAVFSFTIEPPLWLRWWFIVLEVLLGGLLVYFFIRLRLKAIQAKEGEKTRINKMMAEYQMTALSAQMNPHFVFNAINSIQDYILSNNTQQAYDYLTKFSKLVRTVLENAKEKTVTLEKELELLQMYIELEQLRFANKFDIIIDIDDKVDTYDIQIPSMIIQPYVENAIWHGLMPIGNIRRGMLKVSLSKEGRELLIEVEDNGIGRDASQKIRKSTQHKSVGMEITKNRLEVLNNILESNNSEINIVDLHNDKMEPSGTRIEIRITVNTD